VRYKRENSHHSRMRAAVIAGMLCTAMMTDAALLPSGANGSQPGEVPAYLPRTAAELESVGGSRDDVSARKGKERRYVTRKFGLQSADDVRSLIKALPELSKSGVGTLHVDNVQVERVPDELLKELSIHGQGLRRLVLGRWGLSTSPGARPPVISDRGMELISQLQNLTTLHLASGFSGEGFRHLAKLKNLEVLGIYYASIGPRHFFETVSQMCNIRGLTVRYADFCRPIDRSTYEAIGSLDGRLESLDFGEWQETKIDVSMIPAIAQIRSLTWLELGNFVATYEDLGPIRKNLVKLKHFGPNVREAEGIRGR